MEDEDDEEVEVEAIPRSHRSYSSLQFHESLDENIAYNYNAAITTKQRSHNSRDRPQFSFERKPVK